MFGTRRTFRSQKGRSLTKVGRQTPNEGLYWSVPRLCFDEGFHRSSMKLGHGARRETLSKRECDRNTPELGHSTAFSRNITRKTEGARSLLGPGDGGACDKTFA
jgi:hypothetical protein